MPDEPLDPWLDPERAVDTREALERAVHHLGDDALELLVRRYVLGENARELSSGRTQSPAALRVRLMRLRSSARAAR
jgi:DNA-directed RNA polymerase specialized sigma24 family protein